MEITIFLGLSAMLVKHSFLEDEKEAGWERNVEIADTIGYYKLKLLSAFNLTIPGFQLFTMVTKLEWWERRS